MKVRFGHQVFSQGHGGVSRYVVELHAGLLAAGVDSAIDAGLHGNHLLRSQRHVRGFYGGTRPVARHLATRIVNPVGARLAGPLYGREVIYHPSWHAGTIPRRPIVAVTVYDMIHERFGHEFANAAEVAQRKAAWCHRAQVIFAISQHTKSDLIERLHLGDDSIIVTPLGVRRLDPDPRLQAALDDTSPFFLHVGGRSAPYKNVANLLTAYARSDASKDIRLVCFGPAPTDAERAKLVELGIAEKVSFHGGDDAELAAHYAAAVALVYPSRYEGFGLPPLEAMAHGCPVISSDRASLAEVIGRAALTIDPDSVESMTAAMDRIASDSVLRGRLAHLGVAQAAGFPWEQTVARTLQGYRDLVA